MDDCVAEFSAGRSEGGPVQVWHNRQDGVQVVATIPADIGSESQQWAWAGRMARGLCYDVAGLKRAHSAFRRGLLIGGLVAAIGAGITASWLDLRPGARCVDLGDYTTVPNG